MKRFYEVAFSLVCILSLEMACLFAQGTTGSLSGVVTDTSGAVIPGANVTLTNMDTRTARTTPTNAFGIYEFPFAPPGRYDVSVQMKGFSAFRQTGVAVTGTQPVQLPVTLNVGEVSEVVEVLDVSPLLQTRQASNGAVINSRMVRELPVFGRSPLTLLNLVPGSAVNDVTGTGEASKINGSRMGGGIKVLLDGVNIGRENSGSNGTGIVSNPQLESLAEVNVITNNYSAEYGRVEGAVVAMNLKSGTNAFHGDAREFWRSHPLDARNYFNRGAKPPFFSHQFGGTLGGPIRRNKLFFFGAYEGTRTLTPRQGILDTVPTDKVRRGDLSELTAPIFDPTTTQPTGLNARQQFPGNVIPASRLNVSAAKAVQLYPQPNRPGIASNLLVTPRTKTRRDAMDFKVDYYIGPKDSVYGRFSMQPIDSSNPPRLYNFIGDPPNATSTTDNYAAQFNHTHTFAPNLLNEFRFGYLNTNSINGASAENLKGYLGDQIGIPANDPLAISFPQLDIRGWDQLGFARPFNNSQQAGFQFDDTVSLLKGRHGLKFGVQTRWFAPYDRRNQCPAGCYGFNGSFTNNPADPRAVGNAMADFLLGMPFTVSQQFSTPLDLRSTEVGFFLQNDLKVSRNLTLNLGIRWDYFGALSEFKGRLAAYDPASDALVQRPSLSKAPKNLFVPRVGFAYVVTPKTVIRAAYGISTFPQLQGIGNDLLGIPPFSRAQVVERRGTFFQNLTEPAIVLGQALPSLPQRAFPLPASPSINAPYFPNRIPTPSWQMWNFTIQRQVTASLSFDVGYVRTRGAHLDSSTNVDANVPPASQYGPDALFGGKTFQQRRPYPNIGTLIPFDNRGDSEYNGLQTSVNWRPRHGLLFMASYAKQKNMTNHPGRCCNAEFRAGAGGISYQRDISNWKLNWSPDGSTPYDVLVLTYLYELPWGPGKPFLNHKGIVGHIVGGWNVNGTFTARGGNQFGVAAPGAQQGNSDRICDGRLPKNQRSLDRWFDTSCFLNPSPIYRLGNSGYAVLEGIGVTNLDFSALKKFRIHERIEAHFRADFFDLTNTPHFFTGRGVLVGSPNFGKINTSSTERGLTAQPNRSGQLSLRIVF